MQYTKAQLARIWLRCAPIGAWRRLDKLKEKLGSAEHVWDCFTPVYYHEIGPEYFAQLADLRAEKLRSVLQAMDAFQLRAIFLGDEEYPSLLSHIPDPPDVLFVQGSLSSEKLQKAVGMVGSRRTSRYGSSQARKIAGELAGAGVTVISGLALGIDTAAHEGALKAGGCTIGVLGCGHAHFYPAENKELARQMVLAGGAVISEFPPDTPGLPYQFPVRNRIISGLSHALLLIEAAEKSGTHSTVNHALNQGREVFALPGNVDSPGSALPLKLLKEGASICTCGDDILSAMGWQEKPPVQLSLMEGDPDAENDVILSALQLEEKTLEELIEITGLSAQELSMQLTLLELNGRVERRAGRAYALVRQ
ncbi:MAG: DNA-processing protein DprA [Clostridia bacterium]|nr:DNA-processing protein DprA [Clostridia bacterium]